MQVEPDDAFGEYDSKLVKIEPRKRLLTSFEVGMQSQCTPCNADDEEHVLIFTVTDIADDKVALDGNHPLAGIALRFDLNVTEVRAATEVAYRPDFASLNNFLSVELTIIFIQPPGTSRSPTLRCQVISGEPPLLLA